MNILAGPKVNLFSSSSKRDQPHLPSFPTGQSECGLCPCFETMWGLPFSKQAGMGTGAEWDGKFLRLQQGLCPCLGTFPPSFLRQDRGGSFILLLLSHSQPSLVGLRLESSLFNISCSAAWCLCISLIKD